MFNRKPKTQPMNDAEMFLAQRAAIVPPLSMPTINEIATLCADRPLDDVLAEVRQAVEEELERRQQTVDAAQADQEHFLATLRERDEQRQRDAEAHREWSAQQRPEIWVDVVVPDPDAGRQRDGDYVERRRHG
jgi:hypothetical protein